MDVPPPFPEELPPESDSPDPPEPAPAPADAPSSETPAPDGTIDLLGRWHQGDAEALGELIAVHQSWVHRYVRGELGAKLRDKEESMDMVQEAMVRLLRYGPKFVPENRAQFRALLGKVVLNAIRDRIEFFERERRDMDREGERQAASVLMLGSHDRAPTQPDEAAERSEMRSWVRLGLEFLEPDDRRVILLRQWEGHSFDEIAERMQLANRDTARMRFNRALPKLADAIDRLQRGAIQEILGSAELPDESR